MSCWRQPLSTGRVPADGVAGQVAAHQEVGRVHAHPCVRGGNAIVRRAQLVSEASLGLVSQTWSPNELAYYLAFQNDNFNGAGGLGRPVDRRPVGRGGAGVPDQTVRGGLRCASQADMGAHRLVHRPARVHRVLLRADRLALVGAHQDRHQLWSTTRSHRLVPQLATAWRLMFGFENHTLLSWLENSAIYSSVGRLAIVCAIPAGYGLA